MATIPTVGFNVENLTEFKGANLIVWDVGGQEKIRSLWKHYYANINGLLYVVDSSDEERMIESVEEFYNIINVNDMNGVPIVLIANKQDLPRAISCSEIIERFDLERLVFTKNKWFVQSCSAKSSDGILEAFEKMIELLNK